VQRQTIPKKCFVLIPFAAEFEEIFKHAIKAAADEKGYVCERTKEITGPINIVNEIVSNIFEADLIVADLSGQNANVFYELGVAHSVPPPNKTILIADKNEKIPFDIKVYQVLKYGRSFEDILNLHKGIVQRIEFIERQPESSTNPVHDYLFKKDYFDTHRLEKPQAKSTDEDIYAELQFANLRIQLLHFLADNEAQPKGMAITEIYRKMGLDSRKDLVAALNLFFEQGIVARLKENRMVEWRISKKGTEILKKMERRHP